MSELVATRIREHAERLRLAHLTENLEALLSRAEQATMGYLDFLDLVRNLKKAEASGRFAKKLQTYLKPAVLVVDEVGYLPLARPDANMVFQLVARRYERGSILLTANKAFSEWGSVFGDDVLASAILDRLLHHCDVISINGPSYRLKDRLKPSDGGGALE